MTKQQINKLVNEEFIKHFGFLGFKLIKLPIAKSLNHLHYIILDRCNPIVDFKIGLNAQLYGASSGQDLLSNSTRLEVWLAFLKSIDEVASTLIKEA